MCTACRSVCYCNVACQQAHRKKHQQQCQQGVELLTTVAASARATKQQTDRKEKDREEVDTTGDEDEDNNDDALLFQPIPPQDECPICTLPLPNDVRGTAYSTCCGKVLCTGCWQRDQQFMKIPRCAFCREPNSSSEQEAVLRLRKRMELKDCTALFIASQFYKAGLYGLPQDTQKAFELCLRAANLGHATACGSIAECYNTGDVVPIDTKKSRQYLRQSVQSGNLRSRHQLGAMEHNNSNYQKASRHWLLAAAAGDTESLEEIGKYYKLQLGVITQEEYAAALVSYVNVHQEEWSWEREAVKKKNRR